MVPALHPIDVFAIRTILDAITRTRSSRPIVRFLDAGFGSDSPSSGPFFFFFFFFFSPPFFFFFFKKKKKKKKKISVSGIDSDTKMREKKKPRTPDSPTQTVHGAISTLFTPVEHLEPPAQPLDNVFTLEDGGPGRLVGPGDEARRHRSLPVRAEDRRAGHQPRLPGQEAGQGGHPGRRVHGRGRHAEHQDHLLDLGPAPRAPGIRPCWRSGARCSCRSRRSAS